jgi:hypothetical protein
LKESAIDPTSPEIIKIELQLTARFVQFILDSYQDDNITQYTAAD